MNLKPTLSAKGLTDALRWWFFVGLVLNLLVSLIAIFQGEVYPLELLTHFRIQYLLFGAAGLIVGLAIRRWSLAFVGLLAAAINCWVVAPLYQNASTIGPDAELSQSIKVMTANVYTRNDRYEEFQKVVRTILPNILVVTEIDDKWVESLDTLKDILPHRYLQPTNDNFGIGILSTWPMRDSAVTNLGGKGTQSMVSTIEPDKLPVHVIASHPVPPRARNGFDFRNEQLDVLAKYVQKSKRPIIVCGDLNVSNFSPFFAKLLSATRLRDTRKGFGLSPTWPAHVPLLLVPIDHCLASSDFLSKLAYSVAIPGSDHKALVVELLVRGLAG